MQEESARILVVILVKKPVCKKVHRHGLEVTKQLKVKENLNFEYETFADLVPFRLKSYFIKAIKQGLCVCVLSYKHSGKVGQTDISSPNIPFVFIREHTDTENLFNCLDIG